jgi:hypothetical protein
VGIRRKDNTGKCDRLSIAQPPQWRGGDGRFMEPTEWSYALLVWAYALTAFLIASAIKAVAYRLLGTRASA